MKSKYETPYVDNYGVTELRLLTIFGGEELPWEWGLAMAESTFMLTAEADHIPVRGNAIASGDDDYDRKVENEILERLDAGDVWAWASVEVSANCNRCGEPMSEYLGACSYANADDFRVGGYYVDMCDELARRMANCDGDELHAPDLRHVPKR